MSDNTKEKEITIYQIPLLVDEDFLDFFQQYRANFTSSPIFAAFIDQSVFKPLFMQPDQNPDLLDGVTNGLVIHSMLDSDILSNFDHFLKLKKAGITGPDPEPAKVEPEPEPPSNIIDIFAYKRNRMQTDDDDGIS